MRKILNGGCIFFFFNLRYNPWWVLACLCLYQNQTNNYYSGYKHIICTLNLKLMFFKSILYLHFYTNLFRTWKKNFKINYYSTRLTHDFRSISTNVELQTLLCVNGSGYGLRKQSHAHCQTSELKYTAALVKNQF